ncbi:MAG: hypothetical protein AB1489_25725 [Acidobacteriota bacterium]
MRPVIKLWSNALGAGKGIAHLWGKWLQSTHPSKAFMGGGWRLITPFFTRLRPGS